VVSRTVTRKRAFPRGVETRRQAALGALNTEAKQITALLLSHRPKTPSELRHEAELVAEGLIAGHGEGRAALYRVASPRGTRGRKGRRSKRKSGEGRH